MANEGISLRAGRADQNVVRGAQQLAQQEAKAAKRSAERLSKTTDAFTKNFQAGVRAGQIAKKKKEQEKKGYEDTIKKNADALLKNGYSLGESYYNQAKTQVEDIRARYVAAKKAGNEDEADKILLELNLLGDSIAKQKSTIQTNAEIINDKTHAELTTSQAKVVSMYKEENAVFDKKTNTYKYKNTDYDPNDPSKGPKFYTTEDIENNLPLTDSSTIEAYAKNEVTIKTNGLKFHKGEGEGFDKKIMMVQNEKVINEENIQSLMTDEDLFQGKTFANDIVNNPEFQKMLANYLPDENDDGVITWKDFAESPDEGERKLREAIVDPTSPFYSFETSKTLLAEYMTLRQEKLFFNGVDKTIVPEPGETSQRFIDRGGSIGYIKSIGYIVADGIITQDPTRSEGFGKLTRVGDTMPADGTDIASGDDFDVPK